MSNANSFETVMTPMPGPVAKRAGLPVAYIASWAGLACVSAAYIAHVGLGTADHPAQMAAQAVNKEAQAKAELAAANEIRMLRQSLSDYQIDIGRLRTEMEARGQEPSVVAGLTAVEERMSLATGIAPVKTIAKVAPAPAVEAPVASVASQPASPAAAHPAAEPRQIAIAPQSLDKKMSQIETGSISTATKMGGQLPKAAAAPTVETPAVPVLAMPPTPNSAAAAQAVAAPQAAPISFGPAVVKPAPQPFAVQLASGSSIESVKISWSVLSDQHSDALGKLTPRFTSTGTEATGQTFDLVAGPVKTAADAKKICKALAARGTDCKVATYTGEAF